MMRRTIARRCAAPALWSRGDQRPEKRELFAVGKTVHGFTCTGAQRIEDLGFTVFEFRHDKTGAPLHHIDSNDPNNAFCMGFGTPATSSRGTTHVLEHTVLCGSERFPVKDPFFHMLRRSLSTFMNAMTGADYTLYPFATTNVKDYENLLSVYLDATFKPLLRPDDFRQEAHRLEPAEVKEGEEPATEGDAKKRDVQFNGVVFNEMRGVMSEPPRHFMQSLMKELLPGTHYEHCSGGDPVEVLDLTHAEVKEYHAQYYHPSNSVTLTYGDMDPTPHMRMLDEYFAAAAPGARRDIPKLTKWQPEPKAVSFRGPMPVMGDPERQKRVAVSYGVRGDVDGAAADGGTISFERMVHLNLLDTMLTDGPSSPMYKHLIAENQLGTSFVTMTGFSYYLTTPLLTFGVEGAQNTTEAKAVEKVVDAALTEVAKEGFDQRRLDAAVFGEELSQRHRGASYGVNACIGLAALFTTMGARPADYLNWLPHLKAVQQEPGKLQEALKAVVEGNQHKTTLDVTADPKYLEQMRDAVDAKEAAVNAGMTAEAKEELKEDHAKWLERTRAPSNGGDLLPTLTVKDIPTDGFKEPACITCSEGVDIVKTHTNGLVYVSGLIPYPSDALFGQEGEGAGKLSQDQRLWLPTAHSLVTRLGTEGLDYREYDVAAKLCSSGFGISFHHGSTLRAANEYVCGTSFGFYTTHEKLPEALALLQDVLTKPRGVVSDLERQRLITALQARAASNAQGVQHRGHLVAMTAAASKLTEATALEETLGGLTQTNFLNDFGMRLAADADAAVEEAVSVRGAFLEDLRARAATSGMQLWASCDDAHAGAAASALADFRAAVRGTTTAPRIAESEVSHFAAAGDATAAATQHRLPIDTHFVGYAVPNALRRLDADHATVRVALQLLKSEMLHTRVREQGGAYGAMASATTAGHTAGISMASYRDPNPENSTKAFRGAGAWLADSANVTEQRLAEAKLRLFAGIDAPVTADSFGGTYHLCRGTYEEEQQVRARLLATTVHDVMSVAPTYLDEAAASVAVLMPEEKKE